MRLARFERRLIKMHMRWAEHSWPLKPKRRRLKKMPKTTLFNTAPNALAVGFCLATIRLDDWPPKNGQRKNAQLSSNQCPDSYSRPCPESWTDGSGCDASCETQTNSKRKPFHFQKLLYKILFHSPASPHCAPNFPINSKDAGDVDFTTTHRTKSIKTHVS